VGHDFPKHAPGVYVEAAHAGQLWGNTIIDPLHNHKVPTAREKQLPEHATRGNIG
jgi:hypothetical protein